MVMINTIGVLRAIASNKVNRAFSLEASQNAHKALAYPEKRASAEAVLSGGAPSAEFVAEAALRGLSLEEMAQLVISKPVPTIAQRELDRQKLMFQIEASEDPSELEAIVAGVGMGGLHG